ncbi:DUF6319 family protein [Pseudonocardia sp. CA-107938]|uniref:DUF6319 family protein n=1 Tax=Pseudonocardia sp. CA-107938 TaxID=3240021 RepID=UPI003D9016A0
MSAAAALTDAEIDEVRGELAAGRPVTVWFTEAAVGVPVGGSAKVLALGDPAAGEFVQVRPTGSRDELFCSPSELTRVRPPRRRAATAKQPASAPAEVPQPRSAPPAAVAQRRAPAAPAASAAARPATRAVAAEAPEKPRAARKRPGRDTGAPDLTVVLQPSSDGEWVASVTRGAKTVVRPTPVAPADVAKAARCLPPAVGEAVDAALAAARTRQQERVAALQAELEAARQALEDLGG